MKIAIVSDTHGCWQSVRQALEAEDGVDYLFFLGDMVADGQKLAQVLRLPAYIVRGNCDGLAQEPAELTVNIGGVNFLLCHGDRYQVKNTLTPLCLRGQELGADIICFGHTHQPMYEEEAVILINPGSASRPRLLDELPSWGLLELTDNPASGKKVKKYMKKGLPKL